MRFFSGGYDPPASSGQPYLGRRDDPCLPAAPDFLHDQRGARELRRERANFRGRFERAQNRGADQIFCGRRGFERGGGGARTDRAVVLHAGAREFQSLKAIIKKRDE